MGVTDPGDAPGGRRHDPRPGPGSRRTAGHGPSCLRIFPRPRPPGPGCSTPEQPVHRLAAPRSLNRPPQRGDHSGSSWRPLLSCDRAFLSGYQYLTSDREFSIAAGQLRVAKKQNPHLRIHAEWVTVADREITGRFVRHILPHADSLGLNERELGFVYRCLNPAASHGSRASAGSAGTLAQQALEICRSTGLVRLHLHTFGYYIVVCKDPASPEKSPGCPALCLP